MSPSPPDLGTLMVRPDPTDADRILDFAARWHRFGGGSPEDIFITFGIDKATYAARVLAIVNSDSRIDTELAQSIRHAYTRRSPRPANPDTGLDL